MPPLHNHREPNMVPRIIGGGLFGHHVHGKVSRVVVQFMSVVSAIIPQIIQESMQTPILISYVLALKSESQGT